MERKEIFITFAVGEQSFINILDEELVEVVLLDERNTGNHDVVYRFNGTSQNGDWRLGTIEDAYDFAEQESVNFEDSGRQQAEWDALPAE